jgi:hypothetical protein
MLVFVVPLQSPGASRDWGLVSKLANRSIRSLLNQADPRFAVILVCNQPPIDLPSDKKLAVIKRDFAVPGPGEARMSDKWRKVRVGLVAARALTPRHLMVVDADDCVSRRLAGFVADNPDSNGWFFNNGYMHDEGSRLIYIYPRGFDEMCGTSNIVRVGPDDLPYSEETESQDNPILRGGHTRIKQEMQSLGRSLQPLPFPGSVYNLATGENHTGFSLADWKSKKIFIQKLMRYRPLTRQIRKEFNLYTIEMD